MGNENSNTFTKEISFGVYKDYDLYKQKQEESAQIAFSRHNEKIKKRIESLKNEKMLTEKGKDAIKKWGERLANLYKNTDGGNALIKEIRKAREKESAAMIEKLQNHFKNYFNEILNGKQRDDKGTTLQDSLIIKDQEKIADIVIKMGNLLNNFMNTFPNLSEKSTYRKQTIENFMEEFSNDMIEIKKALAKNDIFKNYKLLQELPEEGFNAKFYENINGFMIEIKKLLKYTERSAEDFLDYIKKQKNGSWAKLKGDAGEVLVAWLEYQKENINEKIQQATEKTLVDAMDSLKEEKIIIGDKGSGYAMEISFGNDKVLNGVLNEVAAREQHTAKIARLKESKDKTQNNKKAQKLQNKIDDLESTGVATVDFSREDNELSSNVAKTQDKIDVRIDFAKLLTESDAEDTREGIEVRGASVKHYESSGGFLKPHLQKVNLLRSIAYADSSFMYHWFNLKNLAKEKELEQGNEALMRQMAYEALAHGTIYKNSPDAEVFIGIDSKTGQVFIKDTYSILNKTLLAENGLSSSIEGVNLTFDPKLSAINFNTSNIYNYYNEVKTKTDLEKYGLISRMRAAAMLAQANSYDIQVSLEIDMEKAKGDLYQ